MAAKSRNREINQAQAVTTGTVIRMESPSSGRKPKPNQAFVVMHEVNPVGGFLAFLRDYSVVGLAVGFVIGLQAQTLVKQLVSSFIDPTFNLLFGQALSQRAFMTHFHGRSVSYSWGAFAYALLDFLFVLGAIYAIVKIFNLDKLDKPKKKKDLAKMNELQ
jgi:large conductance mechanosensitive channel